MADLFSIYSEAAAAHPPLDQLAPKSVSLAGKQATAVQDDNGGALPRGRTVFTLNYTNPTQNEDSIDGAVRKGSSGEGDVQADLAYDPVVVGTEQVFAASDFGAPGGAEALVTAPANFGDRSLAVDSVAGFSVGDTVLIENPVAGDFTFAVIKAIVGSTLEFEHDLNIDIEASADLRTANDRTALALGVDYDWADASLGLITIHDTAATQDQVIGVSYATQLEDFAGGDVYAIPGNLPHPDYADPQDVIGDPSAALVGSWNPGEVQVSFNVTDEADFGRDLSVYLITKDTEASPNRGLVRGFAMTVLPPIPTGVATEAGNSRVTIFWDDLLGGGGLLDGYDVMRADGVIFVPGNAEKLNVATIAGTSFTDEDGAPNRVPVGDAPAPVNCSTYSYALVSKVATTLWDTPTAPQTADDPGQTTAIKNLSDA